MSSVVGANISLSLFGQSHSDEIGVVIDGLPAGFTIDTTRLQYFLNRRAPGNNAWSSARKEPDHVEIVTGVIDNVTCGAPLMARIVTHNAHSSDYDAFSDMPRPGHADYPASVKFHGAQDVRGGGHFSGRLTAALCIAGGICLQYLEDCGITIGAHIAQIHTVTDASFNPVSLTTTECLQASQHTFPVMDESVGTRMQEVILNAQRQGDSVGGIIECAALGLPIGVGEPHFDGIENTIARMCFAVPGVKGIEFGQGFQVASLFGSENNDTYESQGDYLVPVTNNAGGILGGLSTGAPMIFRVAVKPTPSIARPQKTARISTSEVETLVVTGRHDPCIVPRAVPVVEAACAIALFDLLLSFDKGERYE